MATAYMWNIQVKNNKLVKDKTYKHINLCHTVTDLNTGKIYYFEDMVTLNLFLFEKYKMVMHDKSYNELD